MINPALTAPFWAPRVTPVTWTLTGTFEYVFNTTRLVLPADVRYPTYSATVTPTQLNFPSLPVQFFYLTS